MPSTTSHARRRATLRALPSATALAGLLASFGAHSQPEADASIEAAEPAPSGLGLGLAFNSRQPPYAGVDRKNRVLPLLTYENSWFRFVGLGGEFKLGHLELAPRNELSFALKVDYHFDAYKSSDSAALSGMEARKGGVWGGGVLAWRNPVAQVRAEWSADLSGHSKGQVLSLRAEHRFGLGPVGLTPHVQAQWQDAKAVDYYYGVRDTEALPNRPAYTPGAATTLEAGLRTDFMLARHQSLFMDLSVTHLPGTISNSPIVDRSNLSSVSIGYLYRF